MILKLLRDILTNADGSTFCHARVSGFAFTVLYCAVGLADFIINHKFEPVAFASGYAATLVAICGGAYIKKDTEQK